VTQERPPGASRNDDDAASGADRDVAEQINQRIGELRPSDLGPPPYVEADAAGNTRWVDEHGQEVPAPGQEALPRLWVEYSLFAGSRDVTAVVKRVLRDSLAVGQVVIAIGDDVPDYLAVVTGISGREVQLRIQLDHLGQPYRPQPCGSCGHDDLWHVLGLGVGTVTCTHAGCTCRLPVSEY